jgi:threonine dehydrogenase-like Zn-dependent dehydrogenase
MKSLICANGTLTLQECEKPKRVKNEVLIKVDCAGICATDLEIVKGYVPGFAGIPGHEFVGHVVEADDAALIGLRVTAEINCACGECDYCTKGMQRHCPNRTVLGIVNRNGAFAEYLSVPRENVVIIPEDIPETPAILIEPLAAALEILEQISIGKEQSVLLVGDGRLAQLTGRVLLARDVMLTVAGKHQAKLDLLKRHGARTFLLGDFNPSPFDIVIEASGKPAGFELALSCVKPRGTIVLKSTYAGGFQFNPSTVVVNEITLVGSRCGKFSEAINFIQKHKPDLSYMISARYPFSQAIEAFEKAKETGALKVVLEME